MKQLMICMAVSVLALSACENAKEQLGLNTSAPDEFAVVKRAPLEFPPDYDLRPPKPGAQRPQELKTDEEAKQAVFGANAPMAKTDARTISGGEAILLQKTNAGAIDPNIRQKVDSETAAMVEESTPGIDAVRKLLGQDAGYEGEAVNPKAEAERLKTNKQQGKPVTDGETPVAGDE